MHKVVLFLGIAVTFLTWKLLPALPCSPPSCETGQNQIWGTRKAKFNQFLPLWSHAMMLFFAVP